MLVVEPTFMRAQNSNLFGDAYVHTIFIQIFIINHDNLMLHILHFITAHFSSFTAYAKLDYLKQS